MAFYHLHYITVDINVKYLIYGKILMKDVLLPMQFIHQRWLK